MGITCKVYHFTGTDLPWADWEQVRQQAAGDTVTMGQRFLHCVECSISNPDKMWYVLVYDDGRPLASACLSSMSVDLGIIAGPGVQRFLGRVRKLFPPFLILRVLFCGLPISLGQKSLLFTREADTAVILPLLDELVVKLAHNNRTQFAVYKEHGEGDLQDLAPLTRYGYRRAESLAMHVFKEPFQNFTHYLSNLNSHYRYDIRRSLRKMERAGVQTMRWTDPVEIRRHYTAEEHQLYLAVVQKSETQLEILPLTFFHKLTRQFPGEVALTALLRDRKIVAFNWSLHTDNKYQFMFCGINYQLNNQLDLYFNLMYIELDHALQAGTSEIKVGQTAPAFKVRLGCTQRPLHMYIKGSGLFSRMLLASCFSILFPKKPPIAPADIYNSKYKPAGMVNSLDSRSQ